MVSKVNTSWLLHHQQILTTSCSIVWQPILTSTCSIR